nr:TPA: hypothetical protein BN1204_046510 [Neospora caninum Liverpool]
MEESTVPPAQPRFLGMPASSLRRPTSLAALSGCQRAARFGPQLSILFILISASFTLISTNAAASDDGADSEELHWPDASDSLPPENEGDVNPAARLGFVGIPRKTMYSTASELVLDGPDREARARKLVELGERLRVDGLVLDLTVAQPPPETPRSTRRPWGPKQRQPSAPRFDTEDVVKSLFQKFALDVEKRAMAEFIQEDPALAYKLHNINVSAEVKQLVASRISSVEVISPSQETTEALHSVVDFFKELRSNREKFMGMVTEKIDFTTPVHFEQALRRVNKEQQVEEVIEIGREEARKRAANALEQLRPEDRVAMGSLGLGMAYLEEAILERMVNPYIMDRSDPKLYEKLRTVVDLAQQKLQRDRREEQKKDAAVFREKGVLSLPSEPAFAAEMPASSKLTLSFLFISAIVGAAAFGTYMHRRKRRTGQQKKKLDDSKLHLDLEELLSRPLEREARSSTRRRARTYSSRRDRLQRIKHRFVEPDEASDISVDAVEDEPEFEVVPVLASSSRFN